VARSRAAAAKQMLAAAAVGLFGFLFLFLRSGESQAAQTQPAAAVSDNSYYAGSLGGGSIAASPSGGGYPQAQTGTS
jgi:hypothetical protein